ncbi:MAG: tetratricopeptide repeat protein [Planctomycetes bacterium]|jgi:Flp pilus assembly protein TadD|nr:tetratricopeptide repeat protein [Planctomycetota bacterium]
MTDKRGGWEPTTRTLVLCALFAAVLLTFAGCGDAGRPPRTGGPITPTTSDPTEAQLLAELQQKFENPQAHYELARVYHKAQNWNKAEWYYNNALGFDPANKEAQAGLVKLFIDRGETAKAERYANSYIRQAVPSVREMLRLGWEFKRLQLDDYTLRCFRQALEADPNSAEANKQMGYYYFEKGDTAKAKQYLMRSFELDPRQPEVAGTLGKLGVVVQLPETPAAPAPAKPK